ncbi:GNAT family N-acetyltransferase [Aestuariivivens marinum]|uniref:GNAT family N-acetyltransferase n=1 Tax=Aestuariivivens marinum TaxID=2913555 RepID=UPI001F5ACEF0|nr:GNAT family N-acetyltransferase [Aestuariivivens marinum]
MEYSEFSRLGVTFKRLSMDTLEMLRQWRNSDDVRPYMIYQKIISPKEQLKWFQELDQRTNYYYFAYINNVPFGVYSIKDIDFEKKTGEPGVFLKNDTFWESDLALRGSLAMGLFAFRELKLETEIIHVLKSNKKVLSYNIQLGFKINEIYDDPISYEMTLIKDDFIDNKKLVALINYLDAN